MTKKVSVIMAEYNTDLGFLKSSIDSILTQSYVDFEFLIVNDGGANDLQAIIEDLHDDRIVLIENDKNRGLVYSLNRAIEYAQGEYLVRMDTDDIALPHRIETLVAYIEAHPEYGVVGSRVIEFSEEGDLGVIGPIGKSTMKSIMLGKQIIHPSVIMRRNVVTRVNGYPDYDRAEDLGLWCELMINGTELFSLEQTLLKYRVNIEDYDKRKLKHRTGEIKARLHYYPKMNAGLVDYVRIFRMIASSVLPNRIVYVYRTRFKLRRDK